MNKRELTPHLVPLPEAARFLGIPRTTLYILLDKQELQSVYIGKRRLVVTESMRAYAEKLLPYPTGPL